jgi:hypothetical protein
VETGLEEVKATDVEANPEDIEAIAERQKVPNEEAAVEAIGALEDRYGDLRLPVRCRIWPKKRNQGNGSSRQKLAAAQ